MPKKAKIDSKKISNPVLIVLAIVIALGAILVIFVIPKIPEWQNQAQLSSEAQTFVGLSREEAKKKAAKEGLHYVEGSVDGKGNLISGNFDPKRITVTIESDKVTKAEFDGQ